MHISDLSSDVCSSDLIFDRSEGLGTTNFVQNINHVRALEGELARTIRSIESVKQARVHLVLPRRELFSRERQQPSASIILTVAGTGLDHQQVTSIQHLVRSEEHTSELQSLMRISYAVFCLKKKNTYSKRLTYTNNYEIKQ